MLTGEGGLPPTIEATAMMNGPMGMWMMGGMGLTWVLVLVALVLVIAALLKYLRS
ncbi:hypothetical protein [Mesorhizobium sp. ISC15]|uniref:hypothetical protein n=1 Tax=Mesorhizobium sp. ISC15 TaxID=3076429 RepID=UPI00269282C2